MASTYRCVLNRYLVFHPPPPRPANPAPLRAHIDRLARRIHNSHRHNTTLSRPPSRRAFRIFVATCSDIPGPCVSRLCPVPVHAMDGRQARRKSNHAVAHLQGLEQSECPECLRMRCVGLQLDCLLPTVVLPDCAWKEPFLVRRTHAGCRNTTRDRVSHFGAHH
jgi:hypothetical protein